MKPNYLVIPVTHTAAQILYPIYFFKWIEWWIWFMQEFFSKWMENDIITKDGLETIKKRREDISCLFDVGRLPGNIKSNYSGYPVAQWKSFVLLFSDVLPKNQLHYWQSFVLACRLLCRSCITKTDLMLTASFSQGVWSELSISPNMHLHLHLHLKECVENYDSIYGFRLFSCECYSSILGSFHTEIKTVAIQIMRKFMTSETLANMQYFLPKEYRYIFFTICSAQLESNVVCGETGQLPELMFSSSGPLAGRVAVWTKSYKLASLDRDELSALRSVYSALYIRVTETCFKLVTLYKKLKSLWVGGEKYGSTAISYVGKAMIELLIPVRWGLESIVTLWFTVCKLKEIKFFMPLLLWIGLGHPNKTLDMGILSLSG